MFVISYQGNVHQNQSEEERKQLKEGAVKRFWTWFRQYWDKGWLKEADGIGRNQATTSPAGQTKESGHSKGNGNKSQFATGKQCNRFTFQKYHSSHSGACLAL